MLRCAVPLLLFAIGALADDPASLHGRALDPTGKPLARVHVRLSSGLPGAAPYGAMTADDGAFGIDGIVPGTYRLLVDHPLYYCVPPDESKPSGRLTFKPGDHVDGMQLHMVAPAVLSGRVLDENGQPFEIEWTQLEIESASDEASSAMLDGGVNCTVEPGKEVGEYRVGLPPGKYYLYLDSGVSGYESHADGSMTPKFFADTWYPSASNKKSAVVVVARAGEETGGLDIRVISKRPLSIAGVVAGGHAGVPVRVALNKQDSISFVLDDVLSDPELDANPDGSFLAKDLAPGTYLLKASAGSGAETLRSTTQKVELTDAPVNGVTLTLLPPANVTGTLQAPNAAGRIVRLEPVVDTLGGLQPSHHTGTVARDGAFEIDDLEPELFRLTLVPMPADRYIKSVFPGSAAPREWSVDNQETGAVLAPVVDLRQGGGLKLAITLGPGASLTGKSADAVVLAPDGKTTLDDSLIAQPNADGVYEFRGLPPGKYRLLGVAADAIDSGDLNLDPLLVKAKTIELKEGEKKIEDLQ